MATRSPIPPTDETLYPETIVGVDGGAGGRDAACLARMLCPTGQRTLVYVQLFDPPGDHPTMLALDLADDGEALGTARAEERRLSDGRTACVRVFADSVAAGLDDEAARRTADLIVVGASHRHGLARLLWGDDASAMLHRSSLALGVAPEGYARTAQVPRRVGAVADLSAASGAPHDHASLLAGQFGAELDVRQFDTATSGPLRTQLLEFAAEVDMVVCTAHNEGLLARLFMASPSDWLVRHVRVPMLIVHEGRTRVHTRA